MLDDNTKDFSSGICMKIELRYDITVAVSFLSFKIVSERCMILINEAVDV